MLRGNGLVIKSVESVLRPVESLWWERFVKKIGLEPEVKERGSYGCELCGAQGAVTLFPVSGR